MKFLATLTAFALSLVVVYPDAVFSLPSRRSEPSTSQCSTGAVRCCNSVEAPDSPKLAPILDALRLTTQSDQHVGLSCDPVPVGSVGGAPSCNAMPVCCSGNDFGGVSMGCSPVPLIL
ncbi:hypothetical protein LXA43DRAFT_586685 [Ganoderma leucocontextum]|nr:hypothetical protein LXA43DRAFT_586685 [Ganoderma leucocontextum]